MTNLSASAEKYIARPYCVVPTETGFCLFRGYSANRAFVGEFSPAELADYFRADMANARQRSAAQLAQEAARRTPDYSSLDINLDSIPSINIDLGL